MLERPIYDWVEQLEPLVRELGVLAGGHRILRAVTITVPRGTPLEAAERLVARTLSGAGHQEVQVTARTGPRLQVLAAEFSR